MTECVLVPTYRRPEMLYHCLAMIRGFEKDIPVFVFPDRGTMHDKEFTDVMECFNPENTLAMWVPEHDYYGNSFNVMEAFRFGYNSHADLIYYIEDDVMIHWDFFKWHREVHEECDDIFAAMGWVFNHYAPITQDLMFQPWYYAIGTSFTRAKLAKIVQHATPRYYEDMPKYVEKVFNKSILNSPVNVTHYEQDGLIQRVLDVDKSQTVTAGMACCSHLGVFGYNRGWDKREDFFGDAQTFVARVAKINQLLMDPYWRASLFGRAIVEREIGKILPPRMKKYRLKLGPYECAYESELGIDQLPKRLRSVPRTPAMEIVVD